MRLYEVIIHDMWMVGKKIMLVVDTASIPGLVLNYTGTKYDFYGLKRQFKFGEKTVVGISRDFCNCTTREEFGFCA